MTEVAPGVFRLGTHIVNWYVVKDGDALTAVDAGLPGFGDALEADLDAHGLRTDQVEAVVLTHSDSDHTGLASRFKEAGARVLIHEADAPALAKPAAKSGDAAPVKLVRYLWRPALWRFMGYMARRGGGHPPSVEADGTFAGGDVLDVPGRPRVLHTPGHTAGHSALLFGDVGVLFVGDSICTWNPLTGSRAPQLMPHAFNEDNRACVSSLEVIAGADAGALLPGHGDPWHGSPAVAAERARAAAKR
ncbi:MAG TPA: MBL fold metallo-hydrolase [Thermoleophilaceae bacterium]|nr:MBL fold metallo-hydrolase [Thermoleophilaceae bacterium]